MPFRVPTPGDSFGPFQFHWHTVAANVPNSSDALFVEYGREDGGTMVLLVDVSPISGGCNDSTQDRFAPIRMIRHFVTKDKNLCNVLPYTLLKQLHLILNAAFAIYDIVTNAMALLIAENGTSLRASIATLPHPYFLANAASWEPWAIQGEPLGNPDAEFNEKADWPFKELPGSVEGFLAFTDGVPNANTSSAFDVHAFLQTIDPGWSASDIVNNLFAAVQNHAGAAWPGDDTTAFCLRR